MQPKKLQKSSVNALSFGGCRYERTSPTRADLTPQARSLDIIVSFENALQLKAAVDECVRELNIYKRKSQEGMKKALILKVDLRAPHLEVTRGKIPKKQ